MAPADDFVEDFVGADRALKRLALMRVARHRPLGGAARARRPGDLRGAGEARRRRGPPRAGHRLRAPPARLALRRRPARARPSRRAPTPAPSPMLELDDVMRDALSDLLQAETRYAPVVDAEGRIAGVLSVEIISEFLTSREALTEEHSGGRAAGRRMTSSPLMSRRWQTRPASAPPGCRRASATTTRQSGCVGGNGFFCFGWAVDNFDRYVDPLFSHLELVVDLGRARVRDRVGARAALAPIPRACSRRSLGFTGVLYTVPSIAFFFLLLPITGLRPRHRRDRALRLHAPDHLPQHRRRASPTCPPSAKDAGRGMGMTAAQLLWRVELPLAVPEIVAGLRIATVSTVAHRHARVLRRGGRPRRAALRADSASRPTSSSPAALAIGMAVALRPAAPPGSALRHALAEGEDA